MCGSRYNLLQVDCHAFSTFSSLPSPPFPQVVLLRNEKEMAEQDVSEIHEAMSRLEADTRNPRLLSVRRAGQMQHIMYEIEDLEQRELGSQDMTHLRTLHEELFNIFEDTLCYLKGGMVQLTTPEVTALLFFLPTLHAS